jgi:putative ABC transport system permease protein
MFDLDRWREIWDALSRNKLRTLLTAFGVFWGLLMLVLLLGSGNGLKHGADVGFANHATNSFFVWTRSTSKPYRGFPVGRRLELTNEDTRAIHDHVPEASVVAPRLQLGGFAQGNNVSRGTKSGAFNVMGDYPEIRLAESIRVDRGRFLNPLDMRERRKVAVIGTRVRQLLFGPDEEPLGEYIRIQGVYFKVVGVFRTSRSGERADEDTQTIHVPFSTFQHAFNQGNRVGWYAVVSRDDVPASEAETAVLDLLRKRHSVHPEDERALGHYNLETEFNEVQGLFAGIRVLVWIVGIGTLAAGVIGVSNIMLVIVKERTNEIGIRRAVGATPLAITLQIVLEAILLTSAAGYLGLIAGMGLLDFCSYLLTALEVDPQMFNNPDVSIPTAIKAVVILVISGSLAGLIPAQRAVNVNTVQALRA